MKKSKSYYLKGCMLTATGALLTVMMLALTVVLLAAKSVDDSLGATHENNH